MTYVKTVISSKNISLLFVVLIVSALSACSGNLAGDIPTDAETPADSNNGNDNNNEGADNDTPDPDPIIAADFQIRSTPPSLILVEGDEQGLTIPLSLTRNNGHELPVQLEIYGRSDEDIAFVTSSFSRLTLTPTEDESEAVLKLSIGDVPLQPQQREFDIIASDGVNRDIMSISVTVEPTDAPDVYLLVGQSNMIGFSGDGSREDQIGGADETNDRIKQLNVSRNNRSDLFLQQSDFTSLTKNVVDPVIVTAYDPLHVPFHDENGFKVDEDYVGLGLSFAKRALADTTADIVLVPAAWSGSSFCANEDGPNGNWMSAESNSSALGNTWLFDRAVTRANMALAETGGVLRGILWHQGESEAKEACAPFYEENMLNLITALRNSVNTVGSEDLRRTSSTIPFVLGTMSRGIDERGDFSEFLDAKQIIDNVHRNLPNLADSVALSNHDDLTPANGYPCGNSSCIHFGPGALREMGQRYYNALRTTITQ